MMLLQDDYPAMYRTDAITNNIDAIALTLLLHFLFELTLTKP